MKTAKFTVQIEVELQYDESEFTENDLKDAVTENINTGFSELVDSETAPIVEVVNFTVHIP